jgi:hypothetical protein
MPKRKEKIYVVIFSPKETRRHAGCIAASQLNSDRRNTCGKIKAARVGSKLLAPERDAQVHRRQRGRIAAPACAAGLLKRKGLFDREPMRDTEAVAACGGWVRLAGPQIPAGAGTARCDRAAERKGRKHDHLDLGRYQRALVGHLGVDLKYAARPIIRRRRVGPDLRAIDRRCHRLDVVDRCLRVALVKRTAAGNGEAKSDRSGETSKPRQLRSVLGGVG